jgi:hypothetical protein
MGGICSPIVPRVISYSLVIIIRRISENPRVVSER